MGQHLSKAGDNSARARHYSVPEEPDIRPARQRRSDVISDPSVFQSIDRHASRVNRSFKSIPDLQNHLALHAKSDLEKVRAFYVYVTGKRRKGNAEMPPKAEQFDQLCSEANIHFRRVQGFAKGNNCDPSVPFAAGDEPNHFWHIVHVSGSWWHVDCSLGESETEVERLSATGERYFLCDAEDFVQSHLPWGNGALRENQRLQLLETPWSLEKFNRRVRLTDRALEFGIAIGTISHSTARIVVSEEIVLQVRADDAKMVGLKAKLEQTDSELRELRGHTLVRDLGGGAYRVRVRPPSCGDFHLCLFGKPQGSGRELYSILRYVITCRKSCKKPRPYPESHNVQMGAEVRAREMGIILDADALDVLVSNDGELDITLNLSRPLMVRGELKFASDKDDSDLPDLDRHVQVSTTVSSLRLEVRMPRSGFYELQVYASQNMTARTLDRALTLIVDCRKGLSKCKAFPKAATVAVQWNCRLLEPRGFHLPAHAMVKLRLTSSKLQRLLPGTVVRDGETWTGFVLTEEVGAFRTLLGSDSPEGDLQTVYTFKVTDDKSLHSVRSYRPLPALTPARWIKSDVIPKPQDTFRSTDRQARQVPDSARRSVRVLARHLTRGTWRNLKKVRAFYCWITHNIRYDEAVSGLRDDPETVLRRGSAVCRGYSVLFQALCSYAGIPCLFLSGLDKAETSSPSRTSRLPLTSALSPLTSAGRIDHAWNLVHVRGAWRHVDCTWGAEAGVVKDKMVRSQIQEFYFLTDAENFVVKHFPFMKEDQKSSERYQLLEKPLSREEFNKRVKLSEVAMVFGLQTDHKYTDVQFSEELELEVRVNAERMDDLTAELRRGKQQPEVKGHTLVTRAGDGQYKVKVVPLTSGRYTLCLLGHPRSHSTSSVSESTTGSGIDVSYGLLQYELNCTKAARGIHPYPKDHTTAYGASPSAADYGLAADALSLSILASSDGTLDVPLPTTRAVEAGADLSFAEVSIPDLDRYVKVTSSPTQLRLEARLPRQGFYRLSVYCRRPTSSSQDGYDSVMTLLVDCRCAKVNCRPFR